MDELKYNHNFLPKIGLYQTDSLRLIASQINLPV